MSADRQDGLTARLVVTRGDLHLDLRLTVAPGQVVALLGPNGTGKSTALGALAGLVPTAPGTDVRLGGHVLDGPGVHVPSAGRRCGLVFQDLRLFGHLSARENVAFGLRATGAPAGAARVAADGWLARLRLVDRAAVRADRLSGGQAQRVALARALAPDPALLLLDEPFASLDAATRRRVRGVLRAAIGSRPVLLVTHDPEDVRDLADDVLTLADPDGTGTVRATRTTRDAAPGPASGPDVAAVVLAGGTARRLGGVDKTALDVGGRAVLDRLLTGLRPSVPDVVLVADPGTATAPWPLRVREDPPGSGPAAALAAGARAVPGARVLVVLAGDQPFAASAVPRLLAALAADPDADAALARTPDGRLQPLLGAYRRSAVGARLAAVRPGDRVRSVTDGLAVVPVPVSAHEGLDVDDPADLDRARAHAAS